MRRTTFEAVASARVSFILATKNRADALDRALTLARAYIKPEDELIVIDGLSTDHTTDVVQRHADIVSVFVSEADRSAGHACNKAMLLAHGKYIRQICDDDVLHPQAWEQAIQVMDAHPEVDLMVCGGTKQSPDNYWTVYLPPGINYGKSVEDVFEYSACGTGFVIRRSALPVLGILPTGPACDVEFGLQAISNGATVKFCRINLYHHPIHVQSYSIRLARECDRHYLRMARQYGSLGIYCRTLLLVLSRRHTLLRFIAYLVEAQRILSREGVGALVRRSCGFLSGRRAPPRWGDPSGHVWDGGFS